VPHPSPDERRDLAAVRAVLPGTEPEIPVEPVGLGGRPFSKPAAVQGRGAAAPGVDLAHGADRAVLDPLDGQPVPLARSAVIAHLGRDAGLLRDARDEARLTD